LTRLPENNVVGQDNAEDENSKERQRENGALESHPEDAESRAGVPDAGRRHDVCQQSVPLASFADAYEIVLSVKALATVLENILETFARDR